MQLELVVPLELARAEMKEQLELAELLELSRAAKKKQLC